MEPRPEKYEVRTPFGRVMIALACVALFVVFVIFAETTSIRTEKSEPEPDICEGLSGIECLEVRDLESRRREHFEVLEEADMMP